MDPVRDGHGWTTPTGSGVLVRDAWLNLVADFMDRSTQTDAFLLREFQAATRKMAALPNGTVRSGPDERILFINGQFEIEIVPEREDGGPEAARWVRMTEPQAIVEYYSFVELLMALSDWLRSES